MNAQKHEFLILLMQDFKFRHNASKTLANVNRLWKISLQAIGYFIVHMRALKIKKVKDM